MIVLDLVLPVFAIIATGYAAVRGGLLAEAGNRGLGTFVFNVALPCLLFEKMLGLSLPAEPPWDYLLAYYLGALAAFAAGMGIARHAFDRPLALQGLAGFGSAYSNAVLLGIPLVLHGFGDTAVAPMFLMLACHSLMMFPLTTFIIELGRGHADEARRAPVRALAELSRNPIVLALAGGLLLNVAGLRLPAALDGAVHLLGESGTGCALFTLGGALARYRLAGDLRESLAIVGVKNLLQPALVAVLAFGVFDVDPLWAQVAVVIAAMPTGINVYLYAHHYQLGEAVMTRAIVMSTALSLFTLSTLLWWFVAR